jgi:LMBR1-like membrane protein
MLENRILDHLCSHMVVFFSTILTVRAVFPLLQSFADSGHRSTRRRLRSALRQNLQYHAILLGILALGLVYILFTVKIDSFGDFESLLIALANTYGLLLTIFCMGHGLVNIPKRMWQRGSLDAQIRDVERSALTSWEAKGDAEDEAGALSAEIATLEREHSTREDFLGEWIHELAARNPDVSGEQPSSERKPLSEDYLSSLTRGARISHNQLLKTQTNWNRLLRRAGYLYDLKSSTENSGRFIEWKLSSPGRLGKIIPSSLQHIWYITVLPWLARSLAVIAGVAGITIIWSEVVHNWTSPLLSLIGIIIRSTGQIWFILEVRYAFVLFLRQAAIDFDTFIYGLCDIFQLDALENLEHV